MRWAMIAGVLGAILPTFASAQVKVVLGEGVSVVFPSAPVKMHMTVESPPGKASGAAPAAAPRPAGGPPMPVPPVEHGFADFDSADTWMLRQGGATFMATALSRRTSHPDLPALCGPLPSAGASCRVIGTGPAAVREDRLVIEGGNVMIRRFLSHGGRAYSVSYLRLSPEKLAKFNAQDRTSAVSVGDSFLASLQVSGPGSK